MKPKIKFALVIDHSWPSHTAKWEPAQSGSSTARVFVVVQYDQTRMYASSSRVEERVEIAAKRIDWGDCVGSDEALEEGAKWAVEGIATVFKKLWPEEA